MISPLILSIYSGPLHHQYIRISITEITTSFDTSKQVPTLQSNQDHHTLSLLSRSNTRSQNSSNIKYIYLKSTRSGQPNQRLFLNPQVNSNPVESTDKVKSKISFF